VPYREDSFDQRSTIEELSKRTSLETSSRGRPVFRERGEVLPSRPAAIAFTNSLLEDPAMWLSSILQDHIARVHGQTVVQSMKAGCKQNLLSGKTG